MEFSLQSMRTKTLRKTKQKQVRLPKLMFLGNCLFYKKPRRVPADMLPARFLTNVKLLQRKPTKPLFSHFSRNLTRISFVFKTAELHDPGPGGTGSPIRLIAYINSLSTSVGSPVIVNGVETAFDTYPEGTLIFNSNGQPFNMVEIDLPYISAEGATGFIIDNVIVITK